MNDKHGLLCLVMVQVISWSSLGLSNPACCTYAHPVSGEQHAQQDCQIVSVLPSLWNFFERKDGFDAKDQVQKFREVVIEPNKVVYEAGFGPGLTALSDERVANYLAKSGLNLQKRVEQIFRIQVQERTRNRGIATTF